MGTVVYMLLSSTFGTVCAEGNVFITVGQIFSCGDLVIRHSMGLSKLVFFQIQAGLSPVSDSFPCLNQV